MACACALGTTLIGRLLLFATGFVNLTKDTIVNHSAQMTVDRLYQTDATHAPASRQFAPDEWRRRPDEFVRPVEVCKAGLCECVSPKPNSAKVASKRVLSLLGWEAAAGR